MSGILLALVLIGFYYFILVQADAVTLKKDDDLLLESGITLKQGEGVEWYFNGKPFVRVDPFVNNSCLFSSEFNFDRVIINERTGSILIPNFKFQHAGRYAAKLFRHKTQSDKVEQVTRAKVLPFNYVFQYILLPICIFNYFIRIRIHY
ncbi:hypothetical protein [Carp edema virus]|nr:hypothetical protein [Carp edema virus]